MTADKNLSHLASTRFSLSKAEGRLLEQVETGEVANYLAETASQNDPSQADTWDDSRQLRATLLVWLCTDTEASQFITHRGIQIQGARIVGSLDLQFAMLPFPLICQQCAFTAAIRLERATVKFFDLSGSYLAGSAIKLPEVDQAVQIALEARGLQVESDVFLRQGFHAIGCVVLWGATIGGNLNCEQGRFKNADGNALFADNIEIRGDVSLRQGFHATGRVSLAGASIGGTLACNQGRFENAGSTALFAEGIAVKDTVLFRNGFHAMGRVSLLGASIGGDLDCHEGRFENAGGDALIAQNIEVKSAVFLCDSFHAKGGVSLSGASIGGNLACDKGRFETATGRDALNAEGIEVKGAVLLRNGFHATGRVSLYGASLGGNLECDKGQFENMGGDALNAEGIEVKGAVLLRNGFHAAGRVSLAGASLGGNLACRQGRFENANGIALNGYSIDAKGAVYLFQGFQAEGKIFLQDAQIADGLYLDSAMLAADSPTTEVDLRFARALTLADSEIIDQARLPQPGKLRLDGFTYEKLSPDSPTDSQYRLRWLQPQQGNGRFSPQPYTQLARVLQASGHEQEATEILIGKQEAARHYGNLSRFKWFWNWFLGKTIAHGYKPTRALFMSLVVIIFGTGLFHIGYRDGWIEASDLEAYTIATAEDSPLTYPEFFPLTYSLDVFLPVIDLHQANYWIPKASLGEPIDKSIGFLSTGVRDGGILLAYFWLQIILGWVLTSLWVAGFTGLVRRLE